MYHYPPLVIIAESQLRLYFKYKGSLGAETDAAWQEAGSPSAGPPASGSSALPFEHT